MSDDILLNKKGWQALANLRLRRLEQVNAENATLRRFLHGVFNGDPEVERPARDMLYGEATQ